MKTYQENSTLIVRESNILEVQKEILKQNLKGIKITTLNRYLSSLTSKQIKWTLNYEISEQFKKQISNLHYLKSNALSSEFIEECRNFLEDLHLYKIKPNELPNHTQIQKELKLLIESIYSLETKNNLIYKTLNNITNIKNTYIDIQYPTYKENIIIHELTKKGAIFIHHNIKNPNYELLTSTNPRCEIEMIAQKIINENININDILIAYCDSSYNHLISSVFDRYHLPIHMNITKPSSLSYKCIALLKFALNPNYDHYMNCLNQNCFKNVDKIIEAQKIYPYNYNEEYPNLNKLHLETEIFNQSEIKQISSIIEQANIQKQEIISDLEQCAKYNNYKELFIKIDEILRKQINKEEIKTLSKIQSYFIDSIQYINNPEDIELLINEISNIHEKNKINQFNSIQCIPFSQLNITNKITFICGASQSTFSEFKSLSGIFDEDYVKEIKNYPTLMERYEYAHSLLMDKCKNGNQIIFSFPQSDYLGKNYESSLDIENITNLKPTFITLNKMIDFKEMIEPLTTENANKLYVRNNTIRGSISSLEKYVGCPYAYFLRYGCHISEPVEVGFNVQKIGTLNHSVLETLVNKYSKDYTKADINEINDIIHQNINDMKQVFPHLQFDLIKRRLLDGMELNLLILNDMEKASFMTPTHCEYKWAKNIEFDELTLSLVGYIDRIDTSPTGFRIVDYKSSSKHLDKEKVFSGQQLQLCTYAMIMNEKFDLRPLGGFYYSFMNSKLSLPYQKYKRREKIIEDISKDSIRKEVIKNNRLEGWIFDDNVEIMDDNATHIKGVSYSKNKGIHTSNVYNLDEISECIVEMMKLIVEEIVSGNIKCEPNEAACMFCKYKPICRFNGTFTEKKQLVEYPNCMRKEKDNG